MKFISRAVGITLALATGPVLAGSMDPPAVASNNWRPEGLERADAARTPWGRQVDSASSAQPSAARPEAHDAVQDFVRLSGPAAKADALATASAACEGCSGTATTVQVISFDGGRGGSADNIAAAWATCSGCSASAVSVQIVLVPRSGTLEANNRSLAVNASCESCSTAAAALQFVLAGAPRRQLSAAATELVSQARSVLAERLEPVARKTDARRAKAEARTAAEETARRLEQIVLDDMGGGEIQRRLDVQIGS